MNDFLKLRCAALLALLPLGFFGCNDTAQNATDNAVNSVAPTPASTRVAPTPKLSKDGFRIYKRTLFVPDGNGELKRIVIEDDYDGSTTPDVQRQMAQQLVALLMEKSPRTFPKGAQVLKAPKDFPDDEKTVAINFNKAFLQDGFWHGESKTGAAIYAIVNTISLYGNGANLAKNEPLKVRFLVEGKPLQSLGEFDLSDPLEPDMSLVKP